jgi:hypothetical protein
VGDAFNASRIGRRAVQPRRWPLAAATLLAVVACSDKSTTNTPVSFGENPSDQIDWDTQFRRPALLQTHIHGLSNHNEPQPASMEWLTHEARRLGYDVLWWTDHLDILSVGDLNVLFRGARISTDQDSVRLANVTRPDWAPSFWSARTFNASRLVSLAGDTLLLRAIPDDAGAPSAATLRLRSDAPWGNAVHAYEFARPLMSGTTLCFDASIEGAAAHTSMQLDLRLSYHNLGTGSGRFRTLRYVLGDSAANVASDSTEVLQIRGAALSPSMNTICLPVSADARRAGGGDNTPSDLQISLTHPAPEGTTLRMLGLTFHSNVRTPSANWSYLRAIADSVEQKMGVRQLLGAEYSPPTVHLGGHIAEQSYVAASILFSPGSHTTFVSRVHQAGGVITYNHPFGWDGDLRPGPSDARLQAVRDSMLSLEAFGADLLEVGYPQRGGVDFRTHLKLWDELGVRGLPLCGIGSGDSHGGFWGEGMNVGPFGTWVWTENLTAATLLSRLRDCRVYFGVPHRSHAAVEMLATPISLAETDSAWYGRTARMGERHVPPGMWSITFKVAPPQAGTVVKLVQAHLSDTDLLEYRISRTIPGAPMELRVAPGDLIRAEVFSEAGAAMFFSNPIWFRVAQ